jgi:hypothetical protein
MFLLLWLLKLLYIRTTMVTEAGFLRNWCTRGFLSVPFFVNADQCGLDADRQQSATPHTGTRS